MLLKQYVKLQAKLKARKVNKGQSLAEYALIIALIAVVCIGALGTLGTNIDAKLQEIAGAIGG